MSKIEPGCLAMVIGTVNRHLMPFIGTTHSVGGRCPVYENAWDMSPPIKDPYGREISVHVRHLMRIDNPPDSAADLLLAPFPKQDKVPA